MKDICWWNVPMIWLMFYKICLVSRKTNKKRIANFLLVDFFHEFTIMLNTTNLAVNCKLCVSGSAWVFGVLLSKICMQQPHFVLSWKGPRIDEWRCLWGSCSTCLIITLKVARSHFGTCFMTYTLSKVTRLLFVLPCSIQLIWWWNLCVTCPVHVKAHRLIFLWNGVMDITNFVKT